MSDRIDDAKLAEWEQQAHEAKERCDKTTPGRWKLWGMDVYADQDGTSNVDTAVRVADTYFRSADGRPRTNDATFIAAAREDVPVLSAAVLALSAEVRRLRSRLDRVTHERECLGTAIADAALKAGIYSGVPVTGPELILLAQAMANVIVGYRAETDERCDKPIGEMAVDSGEEEA